MFTEPVTDVRSWSAVEIPQEVRKVLDRFGYSWTRVVQAPNNWYPNGHVYDFWDSNVGEERQNTGSLLWRFGPVVEVVDATAV